MLNIQIIKKIALKAGKIALEHFKSPKIMEKAVGNLVTNADLEIEQYIRSDLEKLYPEDGVIGEEYGVVAGKNNRYWAVDPIDGTADFANGLPVWGTSIALIENSVVVAAVVYLPIIKKLYHAELGKGAFCNDQKIQVRNGNFNVGSYFATNASAHLILNIDLNLRVCNTPSAISPCYVAEGLTLGAVSVPAYIWDIAAASLIASESGAGFEYLSGSEFLIQDLMNCSKMPEALICGMEEFRNHCRGRISAKR